MKKGKIYIYQEIGGPNGINAEYITGYVNWLVQQYNIKQFIVYINSPGGSYFDALAIYNLLSGYDCEVKIVSQAASAATFVAMAGKKIVAADNSTFWPHKAHIKPEDTGYNEDDFNKESAMLKKISKAMMEAMAKKTGKSIKQIEKLLKKDEPMTAQEAMAFGFVDEVVDSTRISQEVEAYVKQEPNDKISITKNNQKEIEMDLKATIELLGMDEDSTEEQVLAKLKELKALEVTDPPADDPPAVDPPVDNSIEGQVKTLTQEIETIKSGNVQSKIEALVDDAINVDKKILPADRQIFIDAATNDFEATKTRIEAMKKNSAVPVNLETTDNPSAGEYVDPNKACADHIRAQVGAVQ